MLQIHPISGGGLPLLHVYSGAAVQAALTYEVWHDIALAGDVLGACAPCQTPVIAYAILGYYILSYGAAGFLCSESEPALPP